MKKLIITNLVLLFTLAAIGQSEQLLTHFMFNQLNFNPASAGSKEVLDVGAIYRNQWWSGVEGSPKNLNAYGHFPFAAYRNGIGFNIISDKIGLDNILSLGLSYAYRIKLKNNFTLALGIGARFENAKSDWSEINGGVLPDNLLGNIETSENSFNFGPGVYLSNKKFYLGLSIPRLMKNSLYFDKENFGADVNTYYLQTGFEHKVGPNVKLLPNAQLRLNPNSPFDLDINMNVLFFDSFMLGAMYRFEDSIDGLIRYYFKNGLHIGLAMDFTVSELKQATTGSYEIMIGYTFPCDDCTIKNIRYFTNE